MIQYDKNDAKYLEERILLGKKYAIKSQFDSAFKIFDEVERKAKELNYQNIIKKCINLKKKYYKARNKIIQSKNRIKLIKRIEYAKKLAKFEEFENSLKILNRVRNLAKKKNYDQILTKSIETINEIRSLKKNFNNNN